MPRQVDLHSHWHEHSHTYTWDAHIITHTLSYTDEHCVHSNTHTFSVTSHCSNNLSAARPTSALTQPLLPPLMHRHTHTCANTTHFFRHDCVFPTHCSGGLRPHQGSGTGLKKGPTLEDKSWWAWDPYKGTQDCPSPKGASVGSNPQNTVFSNPPSSSLRPGRIS